MVAWPAVGALVVVHMSPPFVLRGMCHNSDGVIHSIKLDQREDYLVHSKSGYSAVSLYLGTSSSTAGPQTVQPEDIVTQQNRTTLLFVGYHVILMFASTPKNNTSPCFVSRQVAAPHALHTIFTNNGLPGLGSEMGAVASMYEVIARRCPEVCQVWPANVNIQHNLVLSTRRAFGLDWSYSNDCTIGHHNDLRTTADQSASRLRDATVITLPNGHFGSFQENVSEFLNSGRSSL